MGYCEDDEVCASSRLSVLRVVAFVRVGSNRARVQLGYCGACEWSRSSVPGVVVFAREGSNKVRMQLGYCDDDEACA